MTIAVIVFVFAATLAAVLRTYEAWLPGEPLPSDWRGPHPHFRRQGLHAAPRGRVRNVIAGPVVPTHTTKVATQ